MTRSIAELVFWGWIIGMILFVYHSAILPGIRQWLRFRLFALRDKLRFLVVEGRVRETDPAFTLLHEKLNFMCSNLARFDLVSAIRVAKTVTQEDQAKAQEYAERMKQCGQDVWDIYHGSVQVFVLAVIFNSIFLFLFASTGVIIFTAVQVGLTKLKDALVAKAEQEGQLVFFNSGQVAV